MSYQSIALTVLLVWFATGAALGVVMQRRGYSGFGWGVVGMVLGPIGVLVALFVHVPPRPDETVRFGIPGPGPIDVLAGVDGSPAAAAAAVAAGVALGDRVGRYTLASVAPIDATPEEEAAARAALEEGMSATSKGLQLAGVRPATIVLHGQPGDALARHARDEGYDVIAIGSHGRGASKGLLGSAAASLLGSSPVPVLVAGHSVGAASRARQFVA